ncbi:MAG: CASTOR/POLLUX-related putative ion channel [Algiphilus sp.]
MYRLRAADRLRYFLERQFIKGAGYQLMVVACTVALVSVIGGFLILPTGEETYGDAVWWAFLRLTDPGYLGDDEGNWRRVVSTWLTISGYVLFMGTLIAILTQWLNRTMRALEQGLTPITVRGHIVVLGMGSRTVPIVGELLNGGGRIRAFLRRMRRRSLRIAVLSQRVDASVAHQFRLHGARGRHRQDVVLRSGSALETADLHRVNVAESGVIILPGGVFGAGEQVSEDVNTIKTLIALREEARPRNDRPLPLVIAELQDHRQADVARAAYPGPLALITVDALVNRILLQQLRYPGIARVYAELLSLDASERFHVREAGDIAGLSMQAARHCFPNAVLCGLVRTIAGVQKARLNPPEETVIAADDHLVFVAEAYRDTAPDRDAREEDAHPAAVEGTPSPARVDAFPAEAPTSGRLLILGWTPRHAGLLATLAQQATAPLAVDIVSIYPAEQRERHCRRALQGSALVQCRQLEADFVARAELAECAPEQYDQVWIVRSEVVENSQEADARAVVGHLVLSQSLARARPRPRVLMELAEAGNRSLLGEHGDDVLVPSLLVSHMLGQGALCPELLAVFDSLIKDSHGQPILLPAQPWLEAADGGDFHTLHAHMAAHGYCLLGWMPPGAFGEPEFGGDAEMPCTADSVLIALAPGSGFDTDADDAVRSA